MDIQDAYKSTCERLGSSVDHLFDAGFKEIIWPLETHQENLWFDLLSRIDSNRALTQSEQDIPDECQVYVRGAKKQKERQNEIQEFIRRFVGIRVNLDPNDNQKPTHLLEVTTGRRLKSDIRNYQVAHIFEGRTSNPYLFCAPWMTCFVPRIIDPFTGDECPGYGHLRKKFIKEGYKRAEKYIIQYNNNLSTLYKSLDGDKSVFELSKNKRGRNALIVAFSPIILEIELSENVNELLITLFNKSWWNYWELGEERFHEFLSNTISEVKACKE